MSFDDRDDDTLPQPIKKIGLKKANPVITQNNISSKKEIFENQANNQFDKIEDYKQQIWDLSVKYKSFIQSKVLPDNRGPIASNLEKEVLDKLVALASVMNEDPNQQEGIGSTALCMLLMKCMLLQRDSINNLIFKLDQLERKFVDKKPTKE